MGEVTRAPVGAVHSGECGLAPKELKQSYVVYDTF